MKKIFFLYLCTLGSYSLAQDKDSLDLSNYTLFEVDSMTINLREVQILKKLKFETYNDKRYYYWFRRKVLKAYPYAKEASEKLFVLKRRLASIPSKRKRRIYTRRVQKYLETEFTPRLKKLTRTEGRILIKLLHREVGEVAFDLVKELRSGWRAFWYNAKANIFKLSLKYEYDPVNVKEDYMIEDILQRAWRDNLIDLQDSKLKFDYFKIEKKWDLGVPDKK